MEFDARGNNVRLTGSGTNAGTHVEVTSSSGAGGLGGLMTGLFIAGFTFLKIFSLQCYVSIFMLLLASIISAF